MPGFGDIPVLGQLFRSQNYISGETELVILVTPRLAKPIDRNRITLPTDAFVEPSDFKYYLLGEGAYIAESPVAHNGRSSSEPEFIQSGQGGIEGEFGHSL